MAIEPAANCGNNGANLDCSTDSVTICPGDAEIPVVICQIEPIPVCFTMTCDTDSITVCVPYDYPEDFPHVSGDVGAFVLAVRNDSGLPLAADGDYIPFTTDETGALRVAATVNANIIINYEYPEDSPHVSGDIGAFVLAVRNDAGTPLAGDGDYIPFTTDATGALRVTTSGGGAPLDCLTDSVTICPGEDPIIVEASNLDIRNLACGQDSIDACVTYDYAEDSPHASGDVGAFVLAVRNDSGLPLAADGDYIPFTTDATGALRVNATFTGDITVALDCATDSVTICPGVDPIVVEATAFDIRPLDCLTDSIEVCQGTSPWVISGTVELGAVTLAALETITVLQGTSPWVIGDGGGSITVDGTVALDAGTLAALETITVLQGTSPWVVSATDLDIRNLVCGQDSVDACVTYDYAEDSPHVSGDVGAFVLAVRNDAGTPLAANGDYIPITTDATGALRVTGGSAGSVFQHEEILCDDDVTFVRKFIQDVNGNVTSVVDFDLEGDPYVVTGTVQVCGGGSTPVTPQSLDSTVDRLTGVGSINVSAGAKSVTIIVFSGNPTVQIDADPIVTLVPGMSLTWAVDDRTESLLNAYAFTGVSGSDFVLATTSGPLEPDVLDSTVERLTGIGAVIIAAGASSVTVMVISGVPTVQIGAGPAIPLSENMSLSWSVDSGNEDLLDAFTFTGLAGDDIVVTSTRI